MKDENLQWSKAAVLICTKCGKSIPGVSPTFADDLKSQFKKELKQHDLHKDIRVMTSSCLDICEEGYQAVAILPSQDASKATVKVFDPKTETELLREEILKLKNL
jgi:predicted metal-binding protein